MTKARPLAVLVAAAALFVLALGASPAHAEFGIEKWEALTCKENTDTPGVGEIIGGLPPIPQSAGQCTANEPAEGPNKWFTQATGHPPFGITDFTLNNKISGYEGFPDGFVKDIVVNLPEGLGVNPEAAPACTIEEMETNPAVECPEAIVGTNYFTIAVKAPTSGECVPPLPEPTSKCAQIRAAVPVFNVEPFEGVPSMVAFPTTAGVTYIVGDLDPADQHIRFTISDIESPLEGGLPVVGSRLVFFGGGGPAGDGTYLTMPSNCAGGQTTTLHVDSHEGKEDTESFTTAVGADECESAPFEPSVETTAGGVTDSPEPATVDVQMPKQLEANARGESHLLNATIKLPEGTALNPASANGLVACTDAQFKKGTDEPIECPAASRIGSVHVETKALDQDIDGDVYVGQPLNNDPSSGQLFRIFIHAFNDRYGVNVRLVGNVIPNLETGQLTAVVPNNPQAPFNSFKVNIDGGPRGL